MFKNNSLTGRIIIAFIIMIHFIIKNMIVRQVQSKPIFGKIRQKSIVAAKSKGASFAFGAIGDDGTLQIGQIKVV